MFWNYQATGIYSVYEVWGGFKGHSVSSWCNPAFGPPSTNIQINRNLKNVCKNKNYVSVSLIIHIVIAKFLNSIIYQMEQWK